MITPTQGTIRDEYDGILQFDRPSVAYDAQGRRYGPGQMRFEPGKHGMAVRVEEGTTNLETMSALQIGVGYESAGTAQIVGSNEWEIRVSNSGTSYYYPKIYARTQSATYGVVSGYLAMTFELYYYADNQNDLRWWWGSSAPVVHTTWKRTDYVAGEWHKIVVMSPIPVEEMNVSYFTCATLGEVPLHCRIRNLQLEAKPYPTTFTAGERKPELLTIPTSVPDPVNPTNLLTENQANGGEDGTVTGFVAHLGATISSSTEQAWQGSRSIKVITEGASPNEGVRVNCPAKIGATYSLSLWIRGSGTARLLLSEAGTGQATLGDVVHLTDSWQRLTVTRTVTTYTTLYCYARIVSQQDTTFYIDGLQLEEGDTATDWCLGAHRRLLGPSEGTVEFWAYVDSRIRSAATPRLVNIRMASGNNALFLWRVDASTWRLSVRSYDDESASNLNIGDAAIADGWRHFAIAWGNGATDLCVDGQPLGRITKTPAVGGLFLPASLGCTDVGAYHANTLFDDIRFSSKARTAEEIAALYNSGKPAPWDEHTTYLWRADGPSAQRVARAVVL
jgi:hypothetical protein